MEAHCDLMQIRGCDSRTHNACFSPGLCYSLPEYPDFSLRLNSPTYAFALQDGSSLQEPRTQPKSPQEFDIKMALVSGSDCMSCPGPLPRCFLFPSSFNLQKLQIPSLYWIVFFLRKSSTVQDVIRLETLLHNKGNGRNGSTAAWVKATISGTFARSLLNKNRFIVRVHVQQNKR